MGPFVSRWAAKENLSSESDADVDSLSEEVVLPSEFDDDEDVDRYEHDFSDYLDEEEENVCTQVKNAFRGKSGSR